MAVISSADFSASRSTLTMSFSCLRSFLSGGFALEGASVVVVVVVVLDELSFSTLAAFEGVSKMEN